MREILRLITLSPEAFYLHVIYYPVFARVKPHTQDKTLPQPTNVD
jgi:hypothetical protein